MDRNILHRSLMVGGVKESTDINDYLTIEALEDGLTASLSTNACEYCIDGNMEWTSLAAGTATPAINTGQTLSFRAKLKPTSSVGIGTFTISNKCNLLGNCMSMLFGGFARGKKSLVNYDYAFYKLFYNCTAICGILEGFLPATTLSRGCYNCMFKDCTNLINAPALPATTLAHACYESMFEGCEALDTVLELPATTLTNYCYRSMFNGCSSLTTVPNLPATTLTQTCYGKMFQGCISLTTAPELPATTLADYCYQFMFSGCSNLTAAPELPATSLTKFCYEYMFQDCTSLTTAPELPTTTLTINCYAYMFKGCTSLTKAPELPATTLEFGCYSYMFNNCTNLVNAPKKLPATILAGSCYHTMFSGCSNLTAAPELPATTLASWCYANMFSNCGSLTTAPELPATTLAENCYRYMFNNCGLTTAPELPATTLVYYCYYCMFYGCGRLNYIKMLATDISATDCLTYWVHRVAATGTFVKNTSAQWVEVGVVPSGWTITYSYTPQECTSLTITADDVSGKSTTTTIHWEAVTNGVNEDGSTAQGIVMSGTAISEEFPQNTSETDTVTREISFTYMGVTATTTITQGVWAPSEYTIDLNSQWQESAAIANPNSATYDGVYESFSNYNVNSQYATMYIDITGYERFQLYIRSYAEDNFDYVMVSQLDQTITGSTSYSDATLVKAHTRGSQSSGTAISNYKLVEFTGIDGWNHRITIVYRKDSVGHQGLDRGYVLIPKNQ